VNGIAVGTNANASSPSGGSAQDFSVAVGLQAKASNVGVVAIGSATNFGGPGAYAVAV
jgi:hypothetical protein